MRTGRPDGPCDFSGPPWTGDPVAFPLLASFTIDGYLWISAAFISLSRPIFALFFFLLGGLSRGIVVADRGHGTTQSVRLGHLVKPRRPQRVEEKLQREDPSESKRAKFGAGKRKKKSDILGGTAEGRFS